MLQLCLAANLISDLRGFVGITHEQPIVVTGILATGDILPEIWVFDNASLVADDNTTVLMPTAYVPSTPGRFLRKSFISSIKQSEKSSGTTNGSGTYTFTFANTYSVAPNVQANIINATDPQIIKIGVPTTTSVTVTVRNRVDVLGLLPSWANVNGALVDILVTEK